MTNSSSSSSSSMLQSTHDRQTDRQTACYNQLMTDRQTDRQHATINSWQTDRQTACYNQLMTDRQTDRQTACYNQLMTDRQTDSMLQSTHDRQTLHWLTRRQPLRSVDSCRGWVSALTSRDDFMSVNSRSFWAAMIRSTVDRKLPKCRNTCSAVAAWVWFYADRQQSSASTTKFNTPTRQLLYLRNASIFLHQISLICCALTHCFVLYLLDTCQLDRNANFKNELHNWTKSWFYY